MVIEAWVCKVEAGDSEGHWSANLAMLASSSLRDCVSKNKDGEPWKKDAQVNLWPAHIHVHTLTRINITLTTHIHMRAHTK